MREVIRAGSPRSVKTSSKREYTDFAAWEGNLCNLPTQQDEQK